MVSANFQYDASTNTLVFTNPTIQSATTTWSLLTWSTTATWSAVSLTWSGSTPLIDSKITLPKWTANNVQINQVLQDLHTASTQLLEAIHKEYTLNINTLDTIIKQAEQDGTLSVLLCFQPVSQSPKQTQEQLQQQYLNTIKQTVTKITTLASELISLDIQVGIQPITNDALNVALVNPKTAISNLNNNDQNGYTAFKTLITNAVTSFQNALKAPQSTEAWNIRTRYQNYLKLLQAYETYSQKISLQGMSIATQDTITALAKQQQTSLFATYIVQRENTIVNLIPRQFTNNSELKTILTNAESTVQDALSTHTNTLLQELLQHKEVQWINTSINTVKSIYTYHNSIVCEAFQNNNYINNVVDGLTKQMNDSLVALNKAANSIKLEDGKLVQNSQELAQWIKKSITEYSVTLIKKELNELQSKVRVFLSSNWSALLSKTQASKSPSIKSQVVGFLIKLSTKYSDTWNYQNFQLMLQTAKNKITTAQSKTTDKNTQMILQEIDDAVNLFLD
jgi:hypothetical protein